MKRIILSLLLMIMPLSIYAFADPIADAMLTAMEALERAQQIPTLINSLAQLTSIDGLIGGLKSDMEGKRYTNNVDTKHQTWSDAQSWDSFLIMAGNGGGGGGDLGGTVGTLNKQFPVDTALNAFNKVNNSSTDQDYYKLQAQTALASRAASQHEFDEIEKNIEYHTNKLEPEAQSTADLKASVDMQNKLQIENNLIMLSVLRQLSLFNQQKALETQEAVNGVYENASFLQKK